MFKKLKDKLLDNKLEVGITALVVGVISQAFGIDIAPTEVDAIITGFAAAAAIFDRVRDRIAAKRITEAE